MGNKNEQGTPGVTGVEVIEIPASYSDFALAAGLPHDASKGDVLAAMAASKNAHGKLVEAVGAKTPEEAIGKLGAERETHQDLVKAIVGGDKPNPTTADAIAKLASDRKSAERVSALGLIERARQEGKTVGDKAVKMFDDHGMAALVAHLDALVPNGPLVNKAPTQPAATAPTPGKGGTDGASGAPAADVPVVLTEADEKMIKSYGLDRAKFIATRKADEAELKAAQQ